MTIPTPAVLRDTLAETVRKDLLGPAGGEDEELHQEEDHVYSRYLVGVLAPRLACEQQPIPRGRTRGVGGRWRGLQRATRCGD